MPFKSQAQSRLMHAAAENPRVAKKTGVKQKAAKNMVKDAAGQKVKKLPQKKTAKK